VSNSHKTYMRRDEASQSMRTGRQTSVTVKRVACVVQLATTSERRSSAKEEDCMAVPTAIDMVGSCRLGISSPESGLDVGGDVAVVDLGKLVVTGLSGRLLSEKTRRCSNGRDMGYYGGFLLDLTILLVVLGAPGFSLCALVTSSAC